MHLRFLVLSIVVLSTVAFCQPGTGPTPFLLGSNAPDAYQISYLPNLNIGDSYIDLTNAGTNGAGIFYGTSASTNGAICVNVYAFAPDEQMVACCSCPVTPDGLFELSGRNDLDNSNVLNSIAAPTSITVKLLATVPLSGSCTNSAYGNFNGQTGVTPVLTLAPGLVAWATKLHLNTTAPASAGYSMTETQFTIPYSGISVGEINRLQQLCMFLAADGSGYGICNSCKAGALGAEKK